MSKLLLESARLEAIFQMYPEPMREDALWLGGYVREKCSRSVDVLEAQVKKLGFSTTASTFLKVLRGQWNRNGDGQETAPIISIRNFQAIIEALRREDRISGLAGSVPYVETGTYRDIARFIDKKRAPQTICKFGVIIGPTGTGKSAAFKHYQQLNNHGLVVHVETPYVPSISKFVTKLAAAYGVSVFLSSEIKLKRLAENLNDRKTLIIDNAQRLYLPSRGSNQPCFNYLQEIQDDTGCTIILSITPEFETVLGHGMTAGYFEQFEGRAGGRQSFLVLDPYPPAEDVLQIAEAYGLRDAEKHVRYLETIVQRRGRIRILFTVLQEAKRLAEVESKPLTIGIVKEVFADEQRTESNN